MGNRKDLNKLYSGILERRGLVRQLFPFLRSDQDTEDMMRFLNKSIHERSQIIADEEEFKLIRSFNSFKLKKELKKASKLRVKITNKEINEQNKFYKHLFSTNKQRINSLKIQQKLMDEHIKQAKEELLDLKRAGGSKKSQRKLLNEINKLKKSKQSEIDSRLVGYNVSGYEEKIEKKKKILASAVKQGKDKTTIQRIEKSIKSDELKHNNILNNSPKKADFTLRNASSIIKESVSTIAKNPSSAAGLFGSIFGTLSRSIGLNPVFAASLLAFAGYKSYIAPAIFGSYGYSGGKFIPGQKVLATNTTTGKQENITLSNKFKDKSLLEAASENASEKVDMTFYKVGKYLNKQGIYRFNPREHSSLEAAAHHFMVKNGVDSKLASDYLQWNRESSNPIDPAILATTVTAESNGRNVKGVEKNGRYAIGDFQVMSDNLVNYSKQKTSPFFIKDTKNHKYTDEERKSIITKRILGDKSHKEAFNAFQDWLVNNPKALNAAKAGDLSFNKYYYGTGTTDSIFGTAAAPVISQRNKDIVNIKNMRAYGDENQPEFAEYNGQMYKIDEKTKDMNAKFSSPAPSDHGWGKFTQTYASNVPAMISEEYSSKDKVINNKIHSVK